MISPFYSSPQTPCSPFYNTPNLWNEPFQPIKFHLASRIHSISTKSIPFRTHLKRL
uniref:Uncharacterized protein n=1 Tax=Anguilla anguilla TaxID=7936 RepID=A0A0E9T6B4_ANGAN